MSNNHYPHIEGLRGNEGEDPATLAVAAVLDPSPHYPDCARIIVGSTRDSESDVGGFSGDPDAVRRLAATLVQAADDVDAALGKLAPRLLVSLTPGEVEAIAAWRPCAIYDRLDHQPAMDAIDKLLRAHGIDPEPTP